MSEWKEHDGGPQPEETKGKRIEFKTREGSYLENEADRIIWPWASDFHPCVNVLRYRLLDTPSSEEAPEDSEQYRWMSPDRAPDQRGPIKTLRDEFAMAALTGILSGYWSTEQMSGLGPTEFADEAYQIADAALAARKEK